MGRTITGTVISDADSTAVVGAICKLQSGEKILEAVNTDLDGKFSVTTLVKSATSLEVSMAGYNPTVILIDAGSKSIDLGTIYLNEGVQLGELTVTANQVIQSGGRTIIFPSESDVKSSATSLSLFQKLPLVGLEANPINRTITVDNGTPMILINGVPSSIDDLNALQPKDIAKIEYSRITPARYANRGKVGLVNITLKARTDGGNVYLWGRFSPQTAFVDGAVQASYHQGPSQFRLRYNPSWRNYQQVYDDVVESYVGDDFRVDLEQHDRNPFNYFTTPIQARYNYSPNKSTLFSATYNFSNTTNKRRTIGAITDTELGDYSFYNQQRGESPAHSLDLFFRRDFNEKNSLEVEVIGTLPNEDYFRQNDYTYASGETDSYLVNTESRRRSLISEISYNHSFSDKTSLAAGYQNMLSHSENEYYGTTYKPVLTENNNYVYANLSQQFGKFSLYVSSVMAMYWKKNDLNKRQFIRNMSSIQGSWDVNKAWSVQALFAYTPSMPSLSSLTDYPQQTTPYLISNGNPDLKVTDEVGVRITPTFKYKKLIASMSLIYIKYYNPIYSDIVYTGNRLFLSQSVNGKDYTNYGASLNARLSDIHGFGINFTVDYNRIISAGENWKHHLNSVRFNWTLWWSKGPWTITYWQKIPGKSLWGHNVSKQENGNSLGVDFKANKHWTFGAKWMYMFIPKGTQYPSWGYSSVNPRTSERYIKHNGNMVVFSFSYNADFGTIFRSARRSLNNSDSGSALLKM